MLHNRVSRRHRRRDSTLSEHNCNLTTTYHLTTFRPLTTLTSHTFLTFPQTRWLPVWLLLQHRYQLHSIDCSLFLASHPLRPASSNTQLAQFSSHPQLRHSINSNCISRRHDDNPHHRSSSHPLHHTHPCQHRACPPLLPDMTRWGGVMTVSLSLSHHHDIMSSRSF